jgi:D-glycero-alpha-D-manno-heptose-7-phosphate kinase
MRYLLSEGQIEASAPCRIDSGGTWDIKALALPLEGIVPVTVNAALSLRTHVVLRPFKRGWVRIRSAGFQRAEAHPVDSLPFTSPLGIFFAAVSYFRFHGLEIQIRSESPVRSALGGSSTALVALIKALGEAAANRAGGKSLSRRQILHLAYHIEDGVSGGYCGLQDQTAAVYGGVNQCVWQYGNPGSSMKRTPLLDRKGQAALSQRLLVAYTGKTHVSARINRNWIRDFLEGKTRARWIEVNRIVHRLADALRKQAWGRAAGLIQEEMALRRVMTPEALTPVSEDLVNLAEQIGCGARFAGAGAGGSLWAIGPSRAIRQLKKRWEEALAPIRGARVLACAVDPKGVR